MAAEEVDKPASSLPQYPEMILAAIEALGDKNGSNKTSISKHIESSYGDLPVGHADLLVHHLDKMKRSGELIMVKNNYMKPDPNAPPKRGRGRPPKPKPELPPGAVLSPPRPRGRPPTLKDPAAAAGSRPRGRPPKKARPAVTGQPRGRGRPPKAREEVPVVGLD
ncbi:hypothetical protein AAC387_Pa03g3128 [Persea americana]